MHILPGGGVGGDGLEIGARLLDVAGLVVGQAQSFARIVAHGIVFACQPADALFDGGGVEVIDREIAGEDIGEFAQPALVEAGGQLVIGGDCAVDIALAGQKRGFLEAGQGRVTRRSARFEFGESGAGAIDIAIFGQRGGGIILVGRCRGGVRTPPFPNFVCRHQQHDQHRHADDEGRKTPPEGFQLVAAQFFFDFAQEGIFAHYGIRTVLKSGRTIVVPSL